MLGLTRLTRHNIRSPTAMSPIRLPPIAKQSLTAGASLMADQTTSNSESQDDQPQPAAQTRMTNLKVTNQIDQPDSQVSQTSESPARQMPDRFQP